MSPSRGVLGSGARNALPLLLIAPLFLYLGALLLYPTLYAVGLALRDPVTGNFPSVANFRVLASDRLFLQALLFNLVLPLLSVAIELVVGLALALLLAAKFPGRRLLRAIVVIPFALPEIVFLAIMRYVFAPRGYANGALIAAGLGPVDWLAPGGVVTTLTVAAVDAWHVTPVVSLLLLAALSAIPDDVFEAARLDGARGLATTAFITLPLLRSAIIAAALLRGVDAVRIFATPLVLAGVEGMPVLSSYAFHQWSDYGNDAAAAAAACVLAALTLLLAIPLLRWRRSAATDEESTPRESRRPAWSSAP